MKYAALLSLLCLLLAVPASAADPTATTPEYVVYYFHGQFRCETCLKIEAWARDAVSEGFGRELKAGNLAWQTVNVQEEPNEHFAADFKLASQAVVVTEWRDGKVIRWKSLEEIWDRLANKQDFGDYIEREVAAFLTPEE